MRARGTAMDVSKEQAIVQVKNYLYAKRSGNLKREQAAYEKLRDWCQKNNVNMENAIAGVTKHLGNTSVSAIMNSLV